ncbi:MAG: adenylylsulfate kinase [Phycisphaerales bacterium]|jgi:adenylylsulfate kinase
MPDPEDQTESRPDPRSGDSSENSPSLGSPESGSPYETKADAADAKADNIVWHHSALTPADRAKALGSRGATLWFTGLSGSGKSTVADALEARLVRSGVHAYRLDGDNVRHGLNSNLGFSAEDRQENIRRVGEVAKLFADASVLTLASFISPYRADRERVRQIHADSGLVFLEVFIDTPIEVCESRDPKGLYKKARTGEIKGFTGIDDPYEAPENAEIHVRTAEQSIEQSVGQIIDALTTHGLLSHNHLPHS